MQTRREALTTIGASLAVTLIPSMTKRKPKLTVSQLKRGSTYTKETILIQPGDKLVGMKFDQCEFIGGGAVLIKRCEFLIKKEKGQPNYMVVIQANGVSSTASIEMGPNSVVTHCKFQWA